MKPLRVTFGGLCWLGLLVWVGYLVTQERQGSASTLVEIHKFYADEPVRFDIRLSTPSLLEVGDGVYLDHGTPRINVRDRPVGEIEALCDLEGRTTRLQLAIVSRARVLLFDNSFGQLHTDASARLVKVPSTSAQW